MVLESETNSLKLSASNEVAMLLDELKTLQHETFSFSSEFMSKMVDIMMNNDQELSNSYTAKLQVLGNKSKEKSEQLRKEMRRDLEKI